MRAVEDWGNLTEAQRETFVKEYKAELEDEEGAGTPAPPPQSGEPAPAAPVAAASPATQASPEAADAAGAEQKVTSCHELVPVCHYILHGHNILRTILEAASCDIRYATQCDITFC